MRRFISILLVCLMTFSLFGCGSEDTSAESGQTADTGSSTTMTAAEKNENQTLVVSLATELQTLSILGMQNIVTNQVLTNIYDGLLTLDQEANICPSIAESWEWDEENMKYTFHIKQGIKFHDGSELTAKDVAFTFDLIKNEYSDYQAKQAVQGQRSPGAAGAGADGHSRSFTKACQQLSP